MSDWCHVLPSMKKGRIVKISRELPTDGPFQSYKDIRRHWKNTYGYRLPEFEDDIIYYQIHFRPLGETLFTYPECCLRSHGIQQLPRVDPIPIITTFLKDLQSKMSAVCGHPLRLQSKVRSTLVDLYSCGKVENTNGLENLQNRRQENKFAYRSKDSIQHLISKKPTCVSSSNSLRHNDSQTPLYILNAGSTDQSHVLQKSTTSSSSLQRVEGSQAHKAASGSMNADFTNNFSENRHTNHMQSENDAVMYSAVPKTPSLQSQSHSLNIPLSQQNNKIVPTFTPRNTINKTISRSGDNASFAKKIIPVFQQKKPSKSSVETINGNLMQHKASSEMCNDSVVSSQLFVVSQDTSNILHNVNIPVFSAPKPIFKPIQANRDKKIQTLKPKVLNKDIKITKEVDKTSLTSPGALSLVSKQLQKFQRMPTASLQSPGCSLNITAAVASPRVQSPLISSTQMLTTEIRSFKRPLSQSSRDEGTPKQKKPRSKPQIQSHLNVEELAKVGQLNKANTITLIAWLNERGITCKSKDKKTDIQDKVKAALNLINPEQ